MEQKIEAACGQDSPACGRRAAGEDPAKREQILDGAKRIFMRDGFDAASMNAITREAGVSKGTIYVYFQNKEDLFGALIEEERNRIVRSVQHALDEHEDAEGALLEFGTRFAVHVTSDHTIRAMRVVIGVIDRMPQLALQFFAASPANGFTVLKSYLDRQVKIKALAISDTELAAKQFIELSTAGLFKHRLFGGRATPPSHEEIAKTVRGAVDVFISAYRPA